VFPFDNSEQIAKVSNTTPTQLATVTLPNLLHHPPLPTSTSLPNSHQPQLCRSKQPPDHNLRPSLSHHPILVYLTLMMQVQLVNWSHLLIVLGPSLVPPLLRPSWQVFLQIRFLLTASSLFRPPWPVFLQIRFLLTTPPLLTILCLRLLLHHPPQLVCNLWLIYLLISCHRSPHCRHLPLRLHQQAADIL
jgi:hypothetical protein